MKKIFRILLVVSLLLYFGWMASFYYAYSLFSNEVADAIAHTGSAAFISLPNSIFWIFPALWLIATVGMLQFSNGARQFFVFLTVVSLGMGAVSGMLIQTGPQAALIEVVNLLDGAIIAIAFFTSVDMEFKNSASNS